MKTKMIYSLILIFGLALAGSTFNNVYGQTPKKTETKAPAVKYTCPMHPEVIKDKSGKCPKCGMTLVVKKEVKKMKPESKKDSTKMKHTSDMKGMKM
ncbi:MAG: heavy metal-binding domain-containing protein [Paludibacter sp.]